MQKGKVEQPSLVLVPVEVPRLYALCAVAVLAGACLAVLYHPPAAAAPLLLLLGL